MKHIWFTYFEIQEFWSPATNLREILTWGDFGNWKAIGIVGIVFDIVRYAIHVVQYNTQPCKFVITGVLKSSTVIERIDCVSTTQFDIWIQVWVGSESDQNLKFSYSFSVKASFRVILHIYLPILSFQPLLVLYPFLGFFLLKGDKLIH